ncbi:MAG: hypothetical protein ACYCQK_01235 [Acidiferrobacteraceae bacterium]
MKPSVEVRKRLAIAGLRPHDSLGVMNAFYADAQNAPASVHAEYWQTMVAVLCERIVLAERSLEKAAAELDDARAQLRATQA